MRSLIFAVAFGIWLSFTASVATAVPITWEFEAVVRVSSDRYLYFPDQILRGSLTFESSIPDSTASETTGRYFDLVSSIDLAYVYEAPYHLADGSPVDLDIATDGNSLGSVFCPVGYQLLSGLQPSGSGRPTSIRRFELLLWSSEPGFLLTDALLLSPPPLSALSPFDPLDRSTTGLFLVSDSGPYFQVAAELTMLRSVPEPAAAGLTLGALVSLAFVRALRSSPVRH